MTYTQYYAGGWKDEPTETTAVVAAALNNMESGIASVDSTASSAATAAAAAQVTASAAIPQSVATTAGDILYATGAGAITRLGIGVTRRVLGVVSGLPSYVESLQSLMTATGDVLYASSANTPARRAIGSTGDVLTVAGGIPTWAAPASQVGFTTYTKVTTKDVTNTGSATDLLNGEITIGAGVLGAGKTMRFTLIGDLLHNQNVATTYAFAAFLGATQIAGTYTTGSINSVQSSTRYWWRLEGTCHGLTSATQETFAHFSAMNAAGTGAADALAGAFAGTAAVDMSSAAVFAVKATCSTASTLESLRLRAATISIS